MQVQYILDTLRKMYPNASCELIHKNDFELLIAVLLSAQTTDEAVNQVTPALFARYRDPQSMASAHVEEVETYLKRIGLYRNKAKNCIACAAALVEHFDSQVPKNRKQLMSLAGVGRKTANVVLSVAFDIPAVAVDTHVERIAKRLGFAKFDDDVLAVERKLKRKIHREDWNQSHHLFIFFGRYFCTAKLPHCVDCPFLSICRNVAFESYKQKKHSK